MKKYLLLLLSIILLSGQSFGQYPGNANDWVEYDQTYFKFSISDDGIYRLSRSELEAAGLSSSELIGQNFKMIRNGEQVPLYVSTNGAFSSSDYIEFYGRRNRADTDTPLYSNPLQQPDLNNSLFSDNSIHFLTLDPSGSNLRISELQNNLNNLPAREEFYLAESQLRGDYRDGRFLRFGGVNLFESTFDDTEGYNWALRSNRSSNYNFGADNVATSANVDATVQFKVASRILTNSLVPGEIELSIGNSSVVTENIDGFFAYDEYIQPFPASNLTNTRLTIRNNSDELVYFSELALTYPRELEFDGTSFSEVNFDKSGSLYVEFSNLPGSQVLVYDLSTNQRIEESVSSITRIRTSNSSTTNNLIFDTEIGSPDFVGSANYENPAVDDYNYLVITHEALEVPINGENYVDKFIDFKSSEDGGGWIMKKVYIDDIIDQFAFGIRGHSAAIKNYVLELRDIGQLPEHIIIIGKGYEYQITLENEIDNDYIPVYGSPGSDSQYVTEYGSEFMLTSIGRISARNTTDLKNYVDKVIVYQNTLNATSDADQVKDKLWMKNAMHLGGGLSASEQNSFRNILNNLGNEYSSASLGGTFSSFFKNTTDPIQNIDNVSIDSLLNSGIALINYFGHSAISTLEFDIQDFTEYDQNGRYPFMITNGCFVGDLFQERVSLGESFLLSFESGTLSFMGPSQFGIASGMNTFSRNFYDLFISQQYGISVGEAITLGHNANQSNSFVNRLTKQQMIFHGDPSLSMYNHDSPDYLLETEDVSFEPNILTSDVEEFDVNVTVSNIGSAINEPVTVRLIRTLPNGEQEIFDEILESILYQELVTFTVETNPLFAEGVNQFTVEIDPDNSLTEITRANNNLLNPINQAIVSASTVPILPIEFGITDVEDVELIAHSSIYTQEAANFLFEIDTTELFNSALLKAGAVSSNGGSIRWKPNVDLQNETVYYWRTRRDEQDSEWENSSFVYLDDVEEGWNQSHYYQFLKDDFDNVVLNEDRIFDFGENIRNLNVRAANREFVSSSFFINYSLDGTTIASRSCGADFMIGVFDENSGIPEFNESTGGGFGRYGSFFCNNSSGIQAFHYHVDTPENRKSLMDFFDQVEDGKYILIFSVDPLEPVANNWAEDANTFGETLYDVFEEHGAQVVDQINGGTPYLFFFQKGNLGFEGTFDRVGDSEESVLEEDILLPVKFAEGILTSDLIGPSNGWESIEWSWDNSFDNNTEGDEITFDVIGISADDTETVLLEGITDLDRDITNIDSNTYPFIRIRVNFRDLVNQTPPQLERMRVIYDQVPEMAIDVTDLILNTPIEFFQNEPVTVTFNLENLHTKDMDAVLVNYAINQAGGGQVTEEERYDALPAGETQEVTFNLDTSSSGLSGNNLLFIDANPNEDQPEQYHFNNIALIEFDVDSDNENPLLDVTFDGVRIINGDLISDTPEILISVTDENPFLLLDDPDDFEILVTFPDQGSPVIFNNESPEVTFFPADDLTDNTAIIEFRPDLQPGDYEMRVQARDRSNNLSGENDYLINFEVTDEDIITQVINYPNPFTTSTEFIARIVGEVPDEILIQIFAPSGQVVSELHSTAGEITLSQGNNYYTVAKWDGTDSFGQPVGNGVYFYKISMKRGGQLIESSDSERYQEYFHNGLGKLYIAR